MGDNFIGAFTGAAFGLTVLILITLNRTYMEVQRIEGRLNALLKQSGVDPMTTAIEAATKLVQAGKTIEAIKVYRNLTGCGLAEAKMKVEAMT